MNKAIRTGLLPLLLVGSTPLAAQTARTTPTAAGAPPEVVRGELGERIDRYISVLEVFGLSGALLVAKDGDVVLHKGYGDADPATEAPVSLLTPFQIGSLGKQFTAAAVLKLEMQGRLSVTDSLGRFFPGAPADKRGITLHQLMTHTAALPYLPESDFMAQVSRAGALEEALGLPLQGTPGQAYAYSNPGYLLLAGVIEAASGQSFEQYLEENIFRPAGMTHTGFHGDRNRWLAAPPVRSSSGTSDEGLLADFPVPAKGAGAGTVVSTVGDLYRWARALESDAVLSAEARAKFFAPHVEVQGPVRYAYGWNVVTTPRNTTVVGHAGDLGGYNAELRRYVDEGLIVAFTSNRRVDGLGYRQAVMNTIALLATGAEPPAPPELREIPRERLGRVEGSYDLPTGGQLFAWVDGRRLMLGGEGQDAATLLAGADSAGIGVAAELNERAERLLRAGAADDLAPLRESLHPSLPFAGVQQGVREEWRALQDSLGAFRDVRVLGTQVFSPAAAKTFYRLAFERGESLGSIGWAGGRIVALDSELSRPMATHFAPVSETEFANFDMFRGRTIRLQARSGTGPAAELRLTSPGGEVVARRTSEVQ